MSVFPLWKYNLMKRNNNNSVFVSCSPLSFMYQLRGQSAVLLLTLSRRLS
jgi:hypothetical protein